MKNNKLEHYEQRGKDITARQELETLYARNGICYAVTKECLLNNKDIITDDTRAYVIERYIVNIDEPIDIKWAEFLVEKGFLN